MKKKNTIFIILCALVLSVLLYLFLGQKKENKNSKEPIQTPAQTQIIEENEKIYFSDEYYYHRVIDCPERKSNMSESSKYSKRSCEFYGDKPCPKCCPEEYKEYINKKN